MKKTYVYLLCWNFPSGRKKVLRVFEDADEAKATAERYGEQAYVERQVLTTKRDQRDVGTVMVEVKTVKDELPFYSAYVRAYIENDSRYADYPKIPAEIRRANYGRGGFQHRVRADTFLPTPEVDRG